jgi:triacylglycerol esterase/lipase EstA (alpha/beta hydrolase family)
VSGWDLLWTLLVAHAIGVVLVLAALRGLLMVDPQRAHEARVWAPLWPEIVWGFWLQLALFPALLLWPRRWHRKQQEALPTLLVHGYAQTRSDFFVMGWRLFRKGRGRLYGVNYSPFGSIERAADTLAAAVARVRAETGAEKVHIVAHSMGGLVSRYYIEQRGGDDVAALVMIGSPQQGTSRARLSLGRSARQMRPQSAFLSGLGAPKPPRGVTYRGVWSFADGIIVPAQSASVAGAGEELILNDHGHLQLLTSQRVAAVVALWLDEVEVSALGDGASS